MSGMSISGWIMKPMKTDTRQSRNIRYLVILIILSILCLTAASVIIGWYHLADNNKKLLAVAAEYKNKTRLVIKMWDIVRDRESKFQNMLIITDPFDLDSLRMAHIALGSEYLFQRNELLNTSITAEERRLIDKLDEATQRGAEIQREIRRLSLEGKLKEARDLSMDATYIEARKTIIHHFEKLFLLYREKTQEALNTANNTVLNETRVILKLTSGILFFSAIAGFIMIRKMAESERKLNEEIRQRTEVQKQLEQHQQRLESDIRRGVEKYKETERERFKSQKLALAMGKILETSLNEIYMFESDSLKFIRVNEGARENLGYSMDELKNMTPLDIKPEMDKQAFIALLDKITSGERKKVTFKTVHRRKDGSSYPVEAHVQLSTLEDKPIFVSMILDISETLRWQNKIQQEKLEAERISHELAFQKIAIEEHAIVCVTDKDENILSINEKYTDISRYEQNEVIGKHFCYGLEGSNTSEVIETISSTIQRGDIWHGVLRFTRKDGRLYWTTTTITPFYNKNAEIYQFVVVSTDITEQKISEEKLLASHEEIHKAHEELEKSHHMMLHSEKLASVGQLAAGIAHEINTPIQFVGDNIRFIKESFDELIDVVKSYESLIRSANDGGDIRGKTAEALSFGDDVEVDYLADEVPSAISQTLEGVARISKIVRSMKDFSHPGTDNLENIDLTKSIESTINVSRNEWKYVAEMVTDFDRNLTSVPCYPGELNQVFLNIIVNAAHAIEQRSDLDKKPGKIRITTRQLDDFVEITIADNGCGMPDEVKKRIFEPFYTTKGVGKGTGQGLAIVYSVIVDKHHGEIEVESTPGEGTTFNIKLPLFSSVTESATDQHRTRSSGAL